VAGDAVAFLVFSKQALNFWFFGFKAKELINWVFYLFPSMKKKEKI
jgi:hypothetical protein